MTQDPYGSSPGSGYVVRGEVVPEHEVETSPPTVPMTQFQKVASALREEPTDPAIALPDAQDAQDARDEADQDATGPEEVVAVRSPDDGTRDYWDDADETGSKAATEAASPDGPAAASADEAAAAGDEPAAAGDEPAAARDDAAASADEPAAAPDETAADAATAGTADAVGTTEAAGAAEASGVSIAEAEPEPVGRHAGAPVQGLRPGESDSAPGDLSDLTYGSLLPDAAEFKVRWQQVQFRFVDDPQGSVTEAADVIAQVSAQLESAISARQSALRDRWSEGKSTDTESLRETLLMYRAFLDQLTGPKTS